MTSWIPHIAALALAVSASSAFAHGKVTCPSIPPPNGDRTPIWSRSS